MQCQEPIKGGMGAVWRVHGTVTDEDFAMKQLNMNFQNEEQKANFMREYKLWKELGQHPYIVKCDFVGGIDGIPTIFAEWMAGGSLKDWIRPKDGKQTGKLYEGGSKAALERTLDIAIQFARGLHYINF
jgi:serine/threonine protein kinase